MRLARGARLHAIGKLAVPDRILRNGPLDAGEWEEMRGHPEIGVEMRADIPCLRETLPVVLHHHERWGGSRSPSGLQGGAHPPARAPLRRGRRLRRG